MISTSGYGEIRHECRRLDAHLPHSLGWDDKFRAIQCGAGSQPPVRMVRDDAEVIVDVLGAGGEVTHGVRILLPEDEQHRSHVHESEYVARRCARTAIVSAELGDRDGVFIDDMAAAQYAQMYHASETRTK